MLTQQQSQRTEIPASDSSGSFNRRRRNSIFVTVTLLIISTLILTVGLAATTRTENVTVGGYYPGVILGFGSILGIIGSNLIENKRQMLVASIVFISFGVIAAFCCAIVDGVFAARHLDLRPIYAGKCRYYISADSEHTTEVTCQIPARGSCFLKIKSNTCYCCELYNCGRAGISGLYYEYSDVKSCQDVIHLYHLLWSVTILNIAGLFLGIITAAILGGFKDMHSNIFPASTPSGLSDDPNSSSQSGPSFMWPSTAPPRYSPPYFPPDEKPPPYTP
ncbi:transmembrane protein 255A isoform X4 [Pseudophryne corroboree]|uniref:transmembrane protein 255A isoform X4 n=1 Tax=Pseudophryne corroboree TaxID=495146 RepID=UPI00308144D9